MEQRGCWEKETLNRGKAIESGLWKVRGPESEE